MTMRAVPALLALTVAAGMLATSAVPSAAAVARCQGRVPTIVGSGAHLTGTPGDDVIVVVAGGTGVKAGAGDDRICVRARKGNGLTFITGGSGDDAVLVEVRALVYADLSVGNDSYRGGPGADLVLSGRRGAANRDRIRLGGGRDELILGEGTHHRQAVMQGGAGDDLLRVVRRSGALEIDAASSTARVDGVSHAGWSSFEDYKISSGGRQSFVGTPGDDTVSFDGRGPVEVLVGDGNDVVELGDPFPAGMTVPVASDGSAGTDSDVLVDLGPGIDALKVRTSASSVVGDQRLGRMSFSDGTGPLGSLGFAGVEDLAVSAPVDAFGETPSRVELIGTEGDNELSASACHVVLRGAGGDDHLEVGLKPDSAAFAGTIDRGCRRSSEVYGEAGDDTMRSHVMVVDLRGVRNGERIKLLELKARDLLDGGEGVDSADAGAGQDTCIAETRVACEG
ncbi:hypothetical protein [Nocardioides sp.]|uniref:hypothetical protein n=1 Tax=Nocardioides sp. TaxID=35761 RepID=UPI002C42EFE9|nr:hypothetical protein [Nocardioides sp.]HXH77796.1 hypothetical protein [Nocardioides sp.]